MHGPQQGGEMPRSSRGGGVWLGAGGIDWCITTTTFVNSDVSYCRLQAAQRTYSSSSKESTAESGEDPKSKPIRFSTSRARHMTLNQTLGIGQIEIEKNPSKKSIYIGMVLMAIMTYIIFFLPPDQDELDLLELEIEKYEREQAKRQW